ncbi:MAG: NADPH-dependent F420 reductase [Methanosarcinales archaeon]|nr:NADPH-dependent F420 reductase [Methanosarcinales archaeon]
MKIALVGGTGDIGEGFAVRWAPKHEIIIGSRKADKAESRAGEVLSGLQGRGLSCQVRGTNNGSAIQESDLVVLCVPFETLDSVTRDLQKSYSDQIVVSPVVPMTCKAYFDFTPPEGSYAAGLVRANLPETVRVVSGFHTIAAAALSDPDRVMNGDVLICGDDREAKGVVADLAREVKNLRPLDAGPLAVSRQVEVLTPLLLNVSKNNKMRQLGIKFIQEK